MGCANGKMEYGLDQFESNHVDGVGFHVKNDTLDIGEQRRKSMQATPKPDSPPSPRQNAKELISQVTKKEVIVPNLRMFQMVDEHARNTPREMTTTVDKLVTYLMSSCTTTLNTVRIFYMWITQHIKYNNSRLAITDMASFDPQAILTSGRTSLCGINLLFHHFCQRTSIPCVLIQGVLRTSGKEPTTLLKHKTRPNHLWSMVLIQDQWRFIDCACGTGFFDLDEQQARVREFFFLPDPNFFIVTHFPLSMSGDSRDILRLQCTGGSTSQEVKEGLQMLETPLKFGQFCQQAMVSIVAMETGVEMTSHARAHVTVNKGEKFAFTCPDLTDVAAVLRDTNSETEYSYSVLCTKRGDQEFRVFVKPEAKGPSKLSVYGKLKFSHDNSFHLLVNYFLRTEEVEEYFSPFPVHFGTWGANPLAVDFGFSRRIYKFDVFACRTGDLYVKLPIYKFTRTKCVLAPAVPEHDENRTSVFGNLSTLTQYTEGVVHIKARFPQEGFYALSLLAQSNDIIADSIATFINMADFVVNCQKSSSIVSPYPKSFPISQTYQCLLLEPMFRDLHPGQTYRFKVYSPLLAEVKVEGQRMEKGRRFDNDEHFAHEDDDDEDDVDNHDEYEEESDEPNGARISFNHGMVASVSSTDGFSSANIWSTDFTPLQASSSVCIYGKTHTGTSFSALYMFNVTESQLEIETVSTYM